MKIIVEYLYLKNAVEDAKNIIKKYTDKVKKYNRSKNEIEFINGDILQMISSRPEKIYGLYADVAMGSNAEYLTAKSKHKNPIWSYEDFNEYFERLGRA